LIVDDHDIVFVADADMAVQDSLKFALELEGLSVHACGSGDELLRHPDLLNAHCVLLDYKMPSMDGFEVLSRLAKRSVRSS
jgi:FixJ family two-component response regulator